MEESLLQELSELDQSRLLELIRRLYGRDAAVDREIAAFAARPKPSAHLAQIRRWLEKLGSRRSSFSHHESFEVSEEIDSIVVEISALLEGGEPTSTLELIEDLLAKGQQLIEEVDDSSGALSTSLGDLVPLWLKAARRCREAGDERDWLARIEELDQSDDYGLLDDLLPQASILLSESELRELVARYEVRAGADANDYKNRRACTRFGLLAWALRDPGIFVRSVTHFSQKVNSVQREEIAKCFLELGDPRGALEWLETPWEDSERSRLRLLVQAYAALGRVDEQIGILRSIWQSHPSVATLKDLLEMLPEEEKVAMEEEGRARAETFADLHQALELLIFLDRTEGAAELCFKRRKELRGESFSTLKELAEHFHSREQPLAASLIYRALLDAILNRGYSRAYHHAADYFAQLLSLAAQVKDWRDEAGHLAYIADLRSQHKRKHGFWSRVGG